jgi:hypothetical protein
MGDACGLRLEALGTTASMVSRPPAGSGEADTGREETQMRTRLAATLAAALFASLLLAAPASARPASLAEQVSAKLTPAKEAALKANGWSVERRYAMGPDGTLGIEAVSACWGTGTYGYIVNYHPDGHRNTREKLCLEYDYNSVRNRFRASCFYDNTLKAGCRWIIYHAVLYWYDENNLAFLVVDETLSLPGSAYYDTHVWQGYDYQGLRCGRDAYGGSAGSQYVRYKVDGVLRAMPTESTYKRVLC